MDHGTRRQRESAERGHAVVSRDAALRIAARIGIGSAALASGLGAQFGRELPAALAASGLPSGLPKKKYRFVFVNHVTEKDAGNPVTYEVLDTGFDTDTEWSRIEKYYLSHRNIAGLFGTAATDTLACGQVSRKYGLAAQGVITAGFDTLPQELALVRSGDLTFTTDQQPYLQGFLPTLQLYLYRLTGGVVFPFNADTSLAYVTRANVDSYLQLQSRFEGTTDAEPA